MKGTSFQKPYEFKLEIEGESWIQGAPVKGTLHLKNHGSTPISLADVHVQLGYGDLKKIHARAPGAFDILAKAPLDLAGATELGAGQENSFQWEFPTTRETPITDNLKSTFLLYGHGDAAEKLGNLQLAILPDLLIQEVLNALRIQFRFVPKSLKYRKGVEGKFDPPTSQSFASLDYLAVTFGFEGDTLALDYVFHLKKVEATPGAAVVKKVTKDFSQTMRPDQYKVLSGRWNHEFIEAAIAEALATVESKLSS